MSIIIFVRCCVSDMGIRRCFLFNFRNIISVMPEKSSRTFEDSSGYFFLNFLYDKKLNIVLFPYLCLSSLHGEPAMKCSLF